MAFRMHRGRSAEDPRKIRAGPPRTSGVRGHRVGTQYRNDRLPSQVPEGTGRDYRFLSLPAPRKIRGRSAEDPRKTPAEDPCGRLHARHLQKQTIENCNLNHWVNMDCLESRAVRNGPRPEPEISYATIVNVSPTEKIIHALKYSVILYYFMYFFVFFLN